MKCPRCGNEDRNFFYQGSKGWYCRKCIGFGRAMVMENRNSVALMDIQDGSENYVLRYPLTEQQKKIGFATAEAVENSDVLIQAVCGAGKTEMVVPLIAKALLEKKRICFAIARRQVVLELKERLSEYFRQAKVIAVCGGYTDVTDGDLIICTTHQLYRYAQAFDYLILDEPDAFPFRGNDVLHGVAKNACRGHIVYMTATPDTYLKKRCEMKDICHYHLNQRPHGKPLPEPRIMVGPSIFLFLILLHWLKVHENHPRMVFVPTIHMANHLGRILHCDVCTSQTENRDVVMDLYKKKKNGVVVATTVLERGVTVPHADICVLFANHSVFDQAGLVQMAGRAGRAFDDPYGDVLFLCNEKSEMVVACRRDIVEANASCIV